MNAMLAKLFGSWTLQSLKFTMSDTGEVIEAPMEGVCTFDANGRWTVVTVPADMSGPTNDAERAALFNRTIAFSGPCEFDGNKLTVIPDFASNPVLKGRPFVRFLELDDDRLLVTQPEWEHPFFPGRKAIGRVTWQREK